MDEAVQILEEKGLLEESQGACIVNLDDFDLPPAMIKKIRWRYSLHHS